MIVTFSSKYCVRCIYWNSKTFNFIKMDLVSSTLGKGLYYSNYIYSSLKCMICPYKTYISPSNNEQLISWFDEISVNKRLESTCTINTREVATWKCQCFFSCPCCYKGPLRFYEIISAIFYNSNQTIGKYSSHR